MGQGSSTPPRSRSPPPEPVKWQPLRTPSPPPPPPQTLTCQPWRKTSDWSEESLLTEIKELNPQKKPNLLTVGPVGAGKSSFINSILSIGKGRKCGTAESGNDGSSYTLIFDIFTEKTLLKNYRLMDCMGIEPTDGQGFHPDDIIALLKGHVKKGYRFDSTKPISKGDAEWRSEPKFEHQIHCVIFVVDAKTIHAGIPREYVQKISQLQFKIKEERIPRILILTKVDLLCDEVRKDFRNLFRSVKVRDTVKIASEVFGIDQASIHPVKNYQVDITIDFSMNIPLLLAVRQAMHYAEDRVDYVLDADDFSD